MVYLYKYNIIKEQCTMEKIAKQDNRMVDYVFIQNAA